MQLLLGRRRSCFLTSRLKTKKSCTFNEDEGKLFLPRKTIFQFLSVLFCFSTFLLLSHDQISISLLLQLHIIDPTHRFHMTSRQPYRKSCKSRAFGSWFTNFSRVLPTSRVGYHADKPIESVVYSLNQSWILKLCRLYTTTTTTHVYCFPFPTIITFLLVSLHRHRHHH